MIRKKLLIQNEKLIVFNNCLGFVFHESKDLDSSIIFLKGNRRISKQDCFDMQR